MQPLNFRLHILNDLILTKIDKSLIIEYYNVKKDVMNYVGLQANVNSKKREL